MDDVRPDEGPRVGRNCVRPPHVPLHSSLPGAVRRGNSTSVRCKGGNNTVALPCAGDNTVPTDGRPYTQLDTGSS